ncbi:hypothetical protein [Flavobacterium ajazii]|uniref:hypothetical protein n=1 Tax=Flavobacterium ajazii TaxID=2692318 RepID=UPI0013D690CB|nr:hypothetical protein [Flavobacterium ajazii]
MAIWQYLLIVVPGNSIDSNYQCIFKNNKTKYLPKTKTLWKDFSSDIFSIVSEMNQIIPKADWGNETFICWKGKEDEEDNDASISLNKNQTKIKEFHFRIDLRKASNIADVLQSILAICTKHKLVLINLKGDIFKPELKDIMQGIQTSNAMSFISDPIKFFEDLSNKK